MILGPNVITVSCNTDLSGINEFVKNKSALEKDPLGVWVLKSTILVNPLTTLTINNSDTHWLKIINNNDKTPNFIKILGSANINNIKITSWNPLSNDTIKQNINGTIPRPFIVVENSTGNVNVSNSEIAYLGNRSYPLNGFVYIHGGNESKITNNSIHDNWDGFYSDSVKSITIKNNKFYNNLRHGIDADAGSHDFNISGNIAYNNNNTGILCSDRCHNSIFDNNTIHDNRGAGLTFSSDTQNSTAKKNYVLNEKVGISIISSLNNKIYNNFIKSIDRGIIIGGTSLGNYVYNNNILNAIVGIYFEGNPVNNILENNTIENVTISIHLNS